MDDYGTDLATMYPTYSHFIQWLISTSTYGGFDFNAWTDCCET